MEGSTLCRAVGWLGRVGRLGWVGSGLGRLGVLGRLGYHRWCNICRFRSLAGSLCTLGRAGCRGGLGNVQQPWVAGMLAWWGRVGWAGIGLVIFGGWF